ncbi:hypothetical protein OBBRIDRAFT_795394 [Obba rivulosa]|uniref:Uncharacterized protein n=1 Tax=Obba rivulosa TaxID=1052685 RepID=A0A8E2AP13_9APHY|nr:hypothetical protein OBBRIDRAFT_795394 [Obba rivulosa]
MSLTHVVQILSHARLLEELDLAACESLFDSIPEFGRSIFSSTHLKTFTIHGGGLGSDICEMVARRQSSFTHLDVRFSTRNPPPDVTEMLAPSKDELEVLKLSFATLKGTSTHYHCVHKLEIQFSVVSCDITKLVHMFPNLLELYMAPYTDLGPYDSRAETRNRNKQAQGHHRWPKLSFCNGDPYSIYVAGLICNIDHLSIATSLPLASTLRSGWLTWSGMPRCVI